MTDGAGRKPGRVVVAAGVVGAAGLGGAALAATRLPDAFFFGWLTAVLAWVAVPLGCLGLLLLHVLVGGPWGWAVRRPLRATLPTLPLMGVLFLPLVPGVDHLYAWASAAPSGDPALAFREAYLSTPFFLLRAAGFFAVWIVVGMLLYRWSRRQAPPEGTAPPVRLRRLAAGGMVVYVVTVSFAAVDWVGSLATGWYSSLFGLYVLNAQVLTAMAAMVLLASRAAARATDDASWPGVLNDLGNLLLALVVLHGYLAFSQFLIIWSGNLPDQVVWFLPRSRGVWGTVLVMLVVAHLAVPMAALLVRRVKRTPALLGGVAALLLAARVVDTAWWVLPASSGLDAATVGVAVLAVAGVGGVWAAAFAWLAGRDSGSGEEVPA